MSQRHQNAQVQGQRMSLKWRVVIDNVTCAVYWLTSLGPMWHFILSTSCRLPYDAVRLPYVVWSGIPFDSVVYNFYFLTVRITEYQTCLSRNWSRSQSSVLHFPYGTKRDGEQMIQFYHIKHKHDISTWRPDERNRRFDKESDCKISWSPQPLTKGSPAHIWVSDGRLLRSCVPPGDLWTRVTLQRCVAPAVERFFHFIEFWKASAIVSILALVM